MQVSASSSRRLRVPKAARALEVLADRRKKKFHTSKITNSSCGFGVMSLKRVYMFAWLCTHWRAGMHANVFWLIKVDQ